MSVKTLIQESALAFSALLSKEYRFTIGRKGKSQSFLDNNDIIFHYSGKKLRFSLIHADYLLENPFKQQTVYLFLASRSGTDHQVCRSLFPKKDLDYTAGQPQFTLLKKEKINKDTGITLTQYDRLTRN